MAKTKFNTKSKTVTITGLTPDEYNILWECLSRCQDAMQWDEECGYAEDGERFLWQIEDKNTFNSLKNLQI